MTKLLRLCLRYPPVSEEAFAVFVLENPEDGGSVLTKESMDSFWELHTKILEIEVSLVQYMPSGRRATVEIGFATHEVV